jgi:hypothetical protein
MKKKAPLVYAVLLLCGMCAAGARSAQALIPATFSAAADENGVSIQYFMPLLGANAVTITPDAPATVDIQLLNNPIATVTLSMQGVSEMPQGVILHYAVESPLLQIPEGDITIPFGELGAEINFYGKLPIVPGGNDVEISLLLLNNRAGYFIAADMPDVTLDPLEGVATPQDSQITRQFTLNRDGGQVQVAMTLTFSWTLPATTGISYAVSFTPVLPDDLPAVPDGADNATLMPPIQGGPIPMPNGSYHLWFNSRK